MTDPKKAKRATVAMKKLKNAIRDTIKKYSLVEPEEEESIDELAEFFADDADKDKIGDENLNLDPEKLTYREIQSRPTTTQLPPDGGEGDEGGAGGDKGSSGGGKGGVGGHDGPGTGGKGTRGRRHAIDVDDVRNTIPDADNHRIRNIFLTPNESGNAVIRFSATGMNTSERLRITATESGTVAHGNLAVDLSEGERTKLVVTFEQPYSGPIEVTAERVQEATE